MRNRFIRLLLCLACGAGCGGALPAAAGAVVIGIGDQSPAMFSDPRFLALHVTTSRDVIPWDVATRPADRADLAGFGAWLAAAQRAGVTPLISFGADYTNPAANYVPTVAQYRDAVKAFLARFPQLRYYTAWNEPDFSYRRLARAPALAAAYFNALVELCRGCTVLAGDLYLPAGGPAHVDRAMATLGPWLRAYVRGLRHRPAGWALHDYFEIRAHDTSQLRILMSVTAGRIWLDETGGVLRRGHWQYPNQSAARAAADERYLLSLATRYHRIARIYHYEWQGNPLDGWDSGLVAANGALRPAYAVLRDSIRRRA